MIKIGVTGGVGCGKSKVLSYLAEHTGCRIILADEVGHLVKEKGTRCYHRLIQVLGTEILEEDGRIHRGKMAELIFADDKLLKEVNGIIHPAVEEYIQKIMGEEEKSGKTEVFFLEAALFIEAGYLPWVDELWYIYSREAVRRQRLKENRNYTEEKITQIMASQRTEEEFRKYASVVIDNSGDFADTAGQIKLQAERLQILHE
ncbi:MAG: dephospho-CoA kinase [Lachnospiraceae bacterium]|nr:dephospho-CoA kinase [Lachnospiraceae bacterium]